MTKQWQYQRNNDKKTSQEKTKKKGRG